MSGQWESQALLQPITAEQPCGENLEDTQLLASFDTFRLFGQSTPFDPAPEWNVIRTRALEALEKSKDLRLLAHLGPALLRTDGYPAFTQSLHVAAEWLDTYWSGVYPLIDEDALLRRNALNCLADPMAVLDGLRRMPLVSSRAHGTFSLRDIDIASGQMPAGENDVRPDEAQIEAAFSEMTLERMQALHDATTLGLAAVKRVEGKMTEEGGTEMMPAFEPLKAQLLKIDRLLRTRLAARAAAAAGEEGAAGEDGAVAGSTVVGVGAIRSRQDAIRALDAVAEFFRQNEPSSPIPILIDRAKRLVSKNFLEVLADIAPDAVAQARAAGGLSQEYSSE